MDGEILKERVAALVKVGQATEVWKHDNCPSKIEEGLYLGSLGAANNREALKSLNITHVLTVANFLSPPYPNDFTYKIIEVADRSDVTLSQYFNECFTFIEEARSTGGSVLVHCFAGISRSATIVVAYLMFKKGMSLSEALAHVKGKRPVVSPNQGFMLQLREYESFSKIRSILPLLMQCWTLITCIYDVQAISLPQIYQASNKKGRLQGV